MVSPNIYRSMVLGCEASGVGGGDLRLSGSGREKAGTDEKMIMNPCF